MKITVIAEIASQHGGDLKLAKRYVVGARWAGADVCKFQYYDADEIMSKDDPRFEKVKAAQLSLEQLGVLKAHCENIGIGFLCTPFKTVKRVEELATLGLHRVKIREADSSNLDIVRRAIDLFDQVLVSTTQIPLSPFLMYHPHIKWLMTIPRYPSKLEELELSRVPSFDGYSNHIPDIMAPLAVAVVAKEHKKEEFWLETHVTLNHSVDNLDKAVSIDFRELKELVGHLRTIEKMKHREI